MLAAIIPGDISQPIRFEDIKAEALHDLVGGDIELRGIRPLSANMYLNENGKIEGLPLNFRATILCHTTRSISADDFIAGDAVLLGPIDDDEGADTGLSAEQVAFLEKLDKEFANVGKRN